jgi:hypothetical protein
VCSSGHFELYAVTTADHDDGLPEKFRPAWVREAVVAVIMIPSIRILKIAFAFSRDIQYSLLQLQPNVNEKA